MPWQVISLGLLASVCSALTNVLAKPIIHRISRATFLVTTFWIMSLILLLASPFFFKCTFSLETIGILAFIALLDTTGNILYFKIIEEGEVGAVTPLLSLSPLFTFLLGWVVLGEKATFFTIAASTLAIFLLMISQGFALRRYSGARKYTVPLSLLTCCIFGFSLVLAKVLLAPLDAPINPPTLYTIRSVLVALATTVVLRSKIRISTHFIPALPSITIRALLVIAQWISTYKGITLGLTGTVAMLCNMSPFFTLIFASLLLNEKITPNKCIAAACSFFICYFII